MVDLFCLATPTPGGPSDGLTVGAIIGIIIVILLLIIGIILIVLYRK